MTVTRRVRFEILRRDNNTCQYCGATAPDVPLTVDHVIPVALGGTDDPSNLVTACQPCNAGKTSTSPNERVVAKVNERAMRWAAALEKAAEDRRAELSTVDAIVDGIADRWDAWKYSDGTQIPKQRTWRASLERFLSVGLNSTDLVRLIEVAMHSKAQDDDKWKYFCGCAWKEVTARQDRALAALSDEGLGQPDSPPADAGWNDGYHTGWRDGHSAGVIEGGEAAESAYESGYRAGAANRQRYEETSDPSEPHEEWTD